MPEQTTEPSKENLAVLIKIFWESLQVPPWSSTDLIDLGKAIYAKKRLDSLDDDLFARLLPHFKTMVVHQQSRLTALTEPKPQERSPLPPSTGGEPDLPPPPKE